MSTRESKGEASTPRLKLVIRRLPPTLPEEIFWNAVAPWVTDATCTWKRFIKGRPSDGPYDHALHSRAYCLMTSVESLVNFHRAFDGHVFRSKTGAEYQAVVEYAPVQKTPLATKAKNDARQGTIDDDPDFKSYLDSLQAPQPKAIIEPSLPVAQPTSTPLLEYLRTQGVKGGKKKAKTESSSTDVARNAAVAAVTASAARRNPKDQGAAMVAGKGRAVVVASASDAPAPGSSGKKSRNKKGKGTAQAGPATVPPPSITAKNFPALAPGPAPKSNSSLPPAAQPSTGPNSNAPTAGPSSRGRAGKGRGIGVSRGEDGSTTSEGRRGAQTDPGADKAIRGGGRGRGRGGGERSARGTVTGILTRNAGEGGATGGRRGRGGITGAPDPKLARIDAET